MASDMNTVALVGRLTRDPEIRHTASGTAIANMRLAFTTRQRDSAGNWVDKSNYIDVVAFGSMGENAGKYLGKGRRVGVDGRLSWREWHAQDGTNRKNIEVVAENLHYLDSNPNANGNGSSSSADDLAPVGAAAGDSPGPDDNVPF